MNRDETGSKTTYNEIYAEGPRRSLGPSLTYMADALNIPYFGNRIIELKSTKTYDFYRSTLSHIVTHDLCVISVINPASSNGNTYYGMQFQIAATKNGSFSSIMLSSIYNATLSKSGTQISMTWGSNNYSTSVRFTIVVYEFDYA